MNAIVPVSQDGDSLPVLIDRASTRLAEARSAGEVLEARDAARAAWALAKVRQAANETQADCLRIINRAQSRLATEVDRAQERGEVARAGGDRTSIPRSSGNGDLAPQPASIEDIGVSTQRLSEWREVRDTGEEVVEAAIQGALDEGRAPTQADIRRAVRGTQGTGDTEWFTPAEWLELVRTVLGVIDVDPASNLQAQQTVGAGRFFTRDDDGLTKEWRGTVWLNPPYAQPLISQFADKLIAELDNGNTTHAIVLTHNYTDTAWFQKLAARADAICFPKGRIRFEAPDGTLASPTQGQAFFYFGTAGSLFAETFRERGFVVAALPALDLLAEDAA
jgi:hypothetical protein